MVPTTSKILEEDLQLSDTDSESEDEPNQIIYEITEWETAKRLSKYSCYEGLEMYEHLPGEPPNTEKYGLYTYLMPCYRTRK